MPMNDQNDSELERGASVYDPNEPTVPDKLGVYDRPERSGLSPVLLILLVLLALERVMNFSK
jgi:hypothetical protein